MILLDAPTARHAYGMATAKGRAGQHQYKNNEDADVRFEFVGVLDLLRLGVECDKDEVWYDIVTMFRPKERSASILPRFSELNAVHLSRPLTKRPSSRVKRNAPQSVSRRTAQRKR